MKKITVGHIVYSFELGGIETLLLSLLNGLDKETFEVHLITLTNDKLKLIPSLDSNVIVHSLDYTPKKLKSFFGLYSGLKDLIKLLNSINPDIIHSHLTSFALLFINTAIKLTKIKSTNIRTVHTAGLFYESQDTLSNKIKLFSEKAAMKLIKTNLVSVSSTVNNNNKKLFKNITNDIKLITNGIDLKKYDKQQYQNIKKENFGVGKDCILISYIARLSYEKNHELLIDIWNEIIGKIPNAVLVIAGDGELKTTLMQKVVDNKLENHIVFLGLINNVPELLSVTDIGVFPSLYEGFGLVLLENFAMKIPVVASKIKSFKNIAKDNYDAFLIPIEDKKKYITKIVGLCKDSELRKEIGNNAYTVSKRYSIDNTVNEYDMYYKSLFKEIE